MDIKKIADNILIFTIKRLIEIVGILIFVIGVLLLIALISYSPSDPNFIFPNSEEIENLLGFHGSYLSDLFLQSVGLISYLIPITFIFTGVSIINKKQIFLIIENTFYVVPYALAGALFLFPGVITDILGFILLIIPIQNSADSKYQSSQSQQDKSKSDVIEGEYRREDD